MALVPDPHAGNIPCAATTDEELMGCDGQKAPQSPKPQKIQTNEKVTKKWLWGRPECNEKMARK